jgi:hypothetical protein
MRTELEKIQLIEKHLEGTLSAQEKVAFNEESRTNPNFKNEIEAQKRVLEGVKRTAFKTKSMKKFKLFKRTQNLWKWGLGGALTIAVLAIVIPLSVKTTSSSDIELIETAQDSTFLVTPSIKDYTNEAENFKTLPQQTFNISTLQDTVIATKEGIVFAIPKNAFVDEDGKTVKGNVQLEVKEAMNTEQIMTSGLTTTSNGKLLETGGMFYIAATSNGKQLQLRKEIHAEVPADDYKPGMQLFDGEKTKDGTINWVSPQKIENWITPVEITALNFYPPGYEAKLKELGYGGKSKQWKDSVYFSFASEGHDYMMTSDTVALDQTDDELAINPSKIAAIWDKKFNNTNLATKEFEDRLQVIFKTCNHAILDLYVNNLDKNFWELDSMAAQLAVGQEQDQFLAFAARKDGRVDIKKGMVKRLSRYYQKRQNKLRDKVEKLQQKYAEEQLKAQVKFSKLSSKEAVQADKRQSENFVRELNVNIREVHKQLDLRPATYKFVVGTLGAKNVDKFVPEFQDNEYVTKVLVPTINSTANRTSTKIAFKGKTAEIEYSPVFVKVENKEQYDRIYCYFLSEQLYSFQRMKDTTGGFKEKLNGFLHYNCATIAYKGDSVFFGEKANMDSKGGTLKLKMVLIPKTHLKAKLDQLAGGSKKSFKQDILNNQAFELVKFQEEKRRKSVDEMAIFRSEIKQVIFPCLKPEKSCNWISHNEPGTMILHSGGRVQIFYNGAIKEDDGYFPEFYTWSMNSDKNEIHFNVNMMGPTVVTMPFIQRNGNIFIDMTEHVDIYRGRKVDYRYIFRFQEDCSDSTPAWVE